MTALLREVIGDVLRRARTEQGRTLREVSDTARVSLGYLSEVERGRKEASSELLSAICGALDIPLSRVTDVSFRKGVLDRLLGSGTLVVESAGEHGELALTEIPHVERVSALLFQLVENERLGDAGPPDQGEFGTRPMLS